MTVAVSLCPLFNGWQGFTVGGLPLNAGLIYTYIASGTTPQATYTTSAGSVQNANPIQLGADGRPPSEIWLINGQTYRFDVTDSLGNLIKTYDNIPAINDPTALAASGGSALVGFLQSGSGAVARTVQSKDRDIFSVKDFGALGDGITSDTSAINTAITALSGLGGGTLYFPRGTYLMSGNINLAANVSLLGESRYLSVIKAQATYSTSGGDHRLVKGTNITDISIRELGFDGNKANQTSPTIRDGDLLYIATGTNSLISINSCFFENCPSGAAVTISGATDVEFVDNVIINSGVIGAAVTCDALFFTGTRGLIHGNILKEMTDTGIAFDNSTDLVISANLISAAGNISQDGIAWASTGNTANILISNNICKGAAGNEIHGFPSAGTHLKIRIINNILIDSLDSPIKIAPTGTAIFSQIVVKNNEINNSNVSVNVPGAVFSIANTASITQIDISENTFDTFDKNGIVIGSIPTRVRIANNSFINCANGNTNDANGAVIRCESTSILDYTIIGNSAYSTTGFMQFAIWFDDVSSTSARNIIADNNWGNPAQPTAAIKSGGSMPTVQIKNNLGFVTENSGTSAAIASGATIAHGLHTTPTFVQVMPSVTGLSNIYISAIGSTTFTVTYSGGGSNVFYWSANTY